jgi:uncharacterized protein YwgA
MKFAYLLQTVRGVPRGYRFHLYNYGPYEDALLADVRQAQAAGLIGSNLLTFPSGGYGYEFRSSEAYKKSSQEHAASISEYSDDLEWVLEQFGNESASRLELISTLVFAMCDDRRRLSGAELIDRVHEIKPHFSKEIIQATIDKISEVLDCVTCEEE